MHNALFFKMLCICFAYAMYVHSICKAMLEKKRKEKKIKEKKIFIYKKFFSNFLFHFFKKCNKTLRNVKTEKKRKLKKSKGFLYNDFGVLKKREALIFRARNFKFCKVEF